MRPHSTTCVGTSRKRRRSTTAAPAPPREPAMVQDVLVEQMQDLLHAEGQLVKALPQDGEGGQLGAAAARVRKTPRRNARARGTVEGSVHAAWRRRQAEAVQGHGGPARRGQRGDRGGRGPGRPSPRISASSRRRRRSSTTRSPPTARPARSRGRAACEWRSCWRRRSPRKKARTTC